MLEAHEQEGGSQEPV